MKHFFRILVTAVGGDLGQSVINALKLSSLNLEVWGADLNADGIGFVFTNGFCELPPAKDSKKYLNAIERYCKTKKIDAVIPCSEIEMRTLCKNRPNLELRGGAKIISQNLRTLQVFGDKLYCFNALEEKVCLAKYANGDDGRQLKRLIRRAGFPLVIKSRISSGSRFLYVAKNSNELRVFLRNVPQPLVQEYIDDRYGEFSIGVFAVRDFIQIIAFKRQLGPVGCTWYAETSQDRAVLQYARQILLASKWQGVGNFQVRKTEYGVRLLEINPRFSSLVAARAVCGFHDVEWSIRNAFRLEINEPAAPYKRIRFQRYFSEMIDLGSGYEIVFPLEKRHGTARP
jgi:carbamoyl-phosphate synthase large subunit